MTVKAWHEYRERKMLEFIAEHRPVVSKGRPPKPCRDVAGNRFESMKAAAEFHGITLSAVWMRIKHRKMFYC